MSVVPEKNCAVFTVCNLAYLPKALVLAESLLKFENEKIHIYIFDKQIDVELPDTLAKYIWIEDAGVPNLLQLAFKYDITEFSTSLKPFLALQLLERFANVIFLDPDTCLYHSLAPVLEDLGKFPIVLTPHYTIPESNDLPNSDSGMMRFGSFNMGFFAVSKSDEGLSFLRWWNDRCIRYCYFETQFGLSTDQKWVSIAPCFFPNLHVSFNLGLNVAMWNAQERRISVDASGTYWINEIIPLIFFHFSSFDEQNPERLSKRPFSEKDNNRQDWVEIASGYNDQLQRNKILASKNKYSFDFMSNGQYISPTLRRAYACVVDELPAGHDPFDINGIVGKFAKRNHLLERSSRQYAPSSYGDMGSNKLKFAVLNWMLLLILRILGPNQFANFSRLLVYLSSYRQNRDLWKL
jgi:hypothetical protein